MSDPGMSARAGLSIMQGECSHGDFTVSQISGSRDDAYEVITRALAEHELAEHDEDGEAT